MTLLSVKEVAELKGCSDRYIRKLISDKKLDFIESDLPLNNQKQYTIPLDSLPEDMQMKYHAKFQVDHSPLPIQLPKPKKQKRKSVKEKRIDEFTADERKEIALWCEILEEWQQVRNTYQNKTEADPLFVSAMKLKHRDLKISVGILYRKYGFYKDGLMEGLLDARGGWNRGKTSIPEHIWQQFLYYYWSDKQITVSQCYQITTEVAKEYYPELIGLFPSERSFRRKLDTLPKAVHTLMRKGEKACMDECLPYIERLYDDLEANDCWIADNHTLDIMSRKNGKETLHRLSLTAFMDAKSGIMVGWNITDNPCSNSTLFALRHAILRHGAPKVVLFDNGTEFLTNDIAGRGHRTRKNQRNVEKPETILSRLGIEMKNALVRNARAKPIERAFLTFKESISKLFDSYTGGHILERPESLKSRIKNGEIPTDSKIREFVDVLIDGIYNVGAYGGAEKNKYKGYSRIDVWNESIKNTTQRIIPEEDLNLLLMRTNGYQKVKRKGVYITISGEKIWYSRENVWELLDKEVYVRYDPTNLNQVRIYDKEDKYMETWNVERDLMLNFLEEDFEALSNANERLAREKKAIKKYAKGMLAELPAEMKIDELDIRIRQADIAKQGIIIQKSNVIMPIIANENVDVLPVAANAGYESVVIDMNKVNRNSEKRKRT